MENERRDNRAETYLLSAQPRVLLWDEWLARRGVRGRARFTRFARRVDPEVPVRRL